MPTTREFRLEIVVLRGLAILLVLLYHLGIPSFKHGYLGVDIFFVISGFLMAQVYEPGEAKKFAIKRMNRILPSYFITIVITYTFCAFWLIPADFNQVKSQTVSSIFMMPNVYFWSRNSYFETTDFNPLLHLWSLGLELQFYVIVPILALIYSRTKKYFFFILLVSSLLCLSTIQISPKTAFFLLPFRLWEFLFGFFISKNQDCISRISVRSRKISVSASFLMLVWVIFVFPINGQSTSAIWGHPALGSLLVTIGVSTLLVCRPAILESQVMRLSLAPLGKISYSLYLVHFPVLALMGYSPLTGTFTKPQSSLDLILALLLISIITFISYQFIETRIRVIGEEGSARTRVTVVLSVIVLSLPLFSRANFHASTFVERKVSESVEARDPYRCGKLNRIVRPFSKTCQIYNSDSESKVLLLGNSHADSLKPAVMKMAKELDFSLYFWVSNDPLMSSNSAINSVIDEVLRHEIDVVILHYSNMSLSDQKWSETLYEFIKIGTLPVVVGPVPQWNVSIPVSILKNQRIELIDRRSFREGNPQVSFLKEIAKKYNLLFFDLSDRMCVPNCVYSDSEGNLLYFDSNHLNTFGAHFLYSFLRDGLRLELTKR